MPYYRKKYTVIEAWEFDPEDLNNMPTWLSKNNIIQVGRTSQYHHEEKNFTTIAHPGDMIVKEGQSISVYPKGVFLYTYEEI